MTVTRSGTKDYDQWAKMDNDW